MYTMDVKAVSRVASEDYNSDAFLFHVVEPVANVNFQVKLGQANTGFGILANKPKAGENATVVTKGEQEVRVGLAVQAGQYAMSAVSGWLIPVASTTAYNIAGRFVTGASSGMLAVLDVNFFRGPTA